MNQKQWKQKIKNKDYTSKGEFWKYRNLARKYFDMTNKKGYVIHHLRDTEEQRNFNDQYYERWGFDFNEEMKYCVCISEKEHRQLHKFLQDTKLRMSESAKARGGAAIKGLIFYNNGMRNIKLRPSALPPPGFVKGMLVTENMKGRHPTKEEIEKAQRTKKERGTDKKSAETRQKMSEAAKHYKKTPEHLKHIREAAIKRRGIPAKNKGTKLSKEAKDKVSERTKLAMQRPEVIEKMRKARERQKDYIWWTNGIKNHFCKECPGIDWYKGYSGGKHCIGTKTWNNGVAEKKSKECPGKGWVLGRLYRVFYTKGLTYKKIKERKINND